MQEKTRRSFRQDNENDDKEVQKKNDDSSNEKNRNYELYTREIKFKNSFTNVDRQSSSDEDYEHPYEWYNRDPDFPQTEPTITDVKSMACMRGTNRRLIILVSFVIGKVL